MPHPKLDHESSSKQAIISTRDNSDYKWQDKKDVIGALEVPCQPDLELRGEYIPRHVTGKEHLFDQALELWNERKWREDFIRACENVPPAVYCCGMMKDDDKTIKDIHKKLTKGWIKAMNQKLRAERKDFIMDIFVWRWHNATGKSITTILLIRFLESPRRSIMQDDEIDGFDGLDQYEEKAQSGTEGQTTEEEKESE